MTRAKCATPSLQLTTLPAAASQLYSLVPLYVPYVLKGRVEYTLLPGANRSTVFWPKLLKLLMLPLEVIEPTEMTLSEL